MQIKIFFIVFITLTNFLTIGVSGAAETQITITGTLNSGAKMSNIISADGKSYSFVNASLVGEKIFKACNVNELCAVTGTVKDAAIQSVFSVRKVQQAYLTFQASEEKPANRGVKERKKAEIKGTMQFEAGKSGGAFWIDGGRNKQYTVAYRYQLEDAEAEKLNELLDTEVIVKGTLLKWKVGGGAFDHSEVIEIFR